MQRTRELIRVRATREVSDREHFEAICRDAAENVGANLVSIWQMDEAKSQVTCLFALNLVTEETSSGQVLHRNDFPTYFETILEQTIVSAPDVRTHPATRDLTKAYFDPNRIESLLDFIIHRNFEPSGIICCESIGERRDWTAENERYLLTLAAATSYKTLV